MAINEVTIFTMSTQHYENPEPKASRTYLRVVSLDMEKCEKCVWVKALVYQRDIGVYFYDAIFFHHTRKNLYDFKQLTSLCGTYLIMLIQFFMHVTNLTRNTSEKMANVAQARSRLCEITRKSFRLPRICAN